MKSSSRALILMFVFLVVIGVAGLLVGVALMQRQQPAMPSLTEPETSAARRPRYNPWGVAAGVGACVCVLVFVKSMLDWFERRDRRRTWNCPQCNGVGVQLTDDGSRKCAACDGSGKIGLDK